MLKHSLFDEIVPTIMVQELIMTKHLSHSQVSLQYGGSHYCGATVLSPEYVLTAAHCIFGYVRKTV
jgi:secreted trypsin-like serine protease